MSLEDSLRSIVREEFVRFSAELSQPQRPKQWISSTELARELGISMPSVRGLVKRGCPHIVPAGHPRFNLAEVAEWCRNNAQKP